MNLEALAKAKKNFVARPVNEELVLVPLRNNVADMTEIFNLNEVGHFIWNEIQPNVSLESIAQKITDIYDVDASTAEADLMTFLKELEQFIMNV